jgi:hypothetical protein
MWYTTLPYMGIVPYPILALVTMRLSSLLHAADPGAAADPADTAVKSPDPEITYCSHYPIDSERPNTCTVEFRSQPRNVTFKPRGYTPFIGEQKAEVFKYLDIVPACMTCWLPFCQLSPCCSGAHPHLCGQCACQTPPVHCASFS